ncbi:hypothetical protein GYMLUDRAFT_691404 [Collybiopsis luxurians FD-317 M1]|uniref:Uncharacterized protein n=1 Tax=Collybiopsis luxurians FD-317 M1 TaxID=944289 RepID=A0A0D0CJI8_9AGAR|nr:hypothetical protein GYMLUDRAFT_691404 [Collybiopsis luxurians FD-317 M1]
MIVPVGTMYAFAISAALAAIHNPQFGNLIFAYSSPRKLRMPLVKNSNKAGETLNALLLINFKHQQKHMFKFG